ncbi:putative transposase OrfB (plasmid) [Klebsiella pneumoniae subsp. pneumoniae]|nr:putative transposase OrfB [Klebsiella pneumoniae subsp. pneumoniae]
MRLYLLCSHRKVQLGLLDTGQHCGMNRVWWLTKSDGIKAQVKYKRPRVRKGEASIVTRNRLQRQFSPYARDKRWITDISYISTHRGWLYLVVVVYLIRISGEFPQE